MTLLHPLAALIETQETRRADVAFAIAEAMRVDEPDVAMAAGRSTGVAGARDHRRGAGREKIEERRPTRTDSGEIRLGLHEVSIRESQAQAL